MNDRDVLRAIDACNGIVAQLESSVSLYGGFARDLARSGSVVVEAIRITMRQRLAIDVACVERLLAILVTLPLPSPEEVVASYAMLGARQARLTAAGRCGAIVGIPSRGLLCARPAGHVGDHAAGEVASAPATRDSVPPEPTHAAVARDPLSLQQEEAQAAGQCALMYEEEGCTAAVCELPAGHGADQAHRGTKWDVRANEREKAASGDARGTTA